MKRTLGFLSIFCISAGAMISSGLFVLPGLAFVQAGPAVFVSYLLAGAVALTTVLSLSELITAMPMAGGDYFYVSRSFGPLFGTVSGLLSWLALSLKSAFAIIGISELVYLVFGLDLRISALLLSVIFTALNLFGVKEAVRFQILLVIALLLILATFFFTGVTTINMDRYTPFFSEGLNAMVSTAGFVFVSFGGVLTTASIAGEVKNPRKNIPLGLISSVLAVTLLYTLIIFTVVGMLPAEELRGALAPIALAGQAGGGQWMYSIIMIASLLAFVTTANGGILTASRYPVALSADGMLPGWVGKSSAGKNTPFAAVILTGLLIAVSVLLDLNLLIKAASTVILLSNIFAHLSVIVMRESNIANYRPSYRSPLYPWLQIISILVFILLIIDMGIQPILISLIFISAGVLLFFLRRGNPDKASPALIHVLERITNKKLVTRGLREELRTIIEDRDEIVKDEFDHTMDSSYFMEADRVGSLEEFWDKLSKEIHDTMFPDISVEELKRLLKQREAESSTAISSFVAIPHMVIEGSDTFKLMLVRAKEGIPFDSSHQAVKAVFVLVGTKDMRNLHLRSLAALAQVVQHTGFEHQWLDALGHEDLKDLFLFSKRRRG